MTSWRDYIRVVSNGEPIDAAADTRPISDLAQRTQYLREALDAATAGRALIEFDVVLDAATVVCTPVYIDSDGVWKPAIAEIYPDGPMAGRFKPAANIIGVVVTKTASTRGHVVMGGAVDGLPWANVITGTPTPGVYALSPSEAGKLVALGTGSASVAVGQLLANGTFIVTKAPKNGAEDHLHYRFALSGEPAVADYTDVTKPGVGSDHIINPLDIDLTLPGWVPVSHAATPAAIPVGAQFWYNIAADPALAQAFPPIPAAAYFATQGRGVVLDTDLVITTAGIFWMTKAYGQVPWPIEYGDAGYDYATNISLFMAKMTADTFTRVVRSLKIKETSALPFVITTTDGEDGSTGDLIFSLDEFLPVAETENAGRRAVKEIVGNAVKRGPIVSGVYTTTSGIRITAEEIIGGRGIGAIGIGIDAGLFVNCLFPDLIRHDGTREDQYQEFSYTAFPNGRATAAVMTLVVPKLGTPPVSAMSIELLFLGVAASSTFVLELSARVAKASATATAVPTTWTSLGTISSGAIAAGQTKLVIAATTLPGVEPGDEIVIKVARPVDAVTAVAGVMRVRGILNP